MARCQHGTDLQIFVCKQCKKEKEDRCRIIDALNICADSYHMHKKIEEINQALDNKRIAAKFTHYPRGSEAFNAIQQELDQKVTEACE